MRFITLQAMMGKAGKAAIKLQPYDVKSIVGPLHSAETDTTYTEVRDGYGGQVFRVMETPDEIEAMIEREAKR